MTHYKLDAGVRLRHDICVKIHSQACTALLLGVLALLPACKPQGPNIAKLKDVQRRNADLHQEIAEMHALIQRVGEDIPGLADRLDERTREERQAYERLIALKQKETELRLRRIELEGRRDAFRSTFKSLQSQVAASTTEQP